MSFIGSTSFGFAQNTIHDFQNTILNLVDVSSTNATKMRENWNRWSVGTGRERYQAILCGMSVRTVSG